MTITANGGNSFIVSDLVSGTSPITQNGVHQAVRVGDVVFDNFFQRGVPYSEYIGALQAPLGVTITTRPF
jgi:hypothetical protein